MRRKVKNEDSRTLNQTQLTSVNSSCHKGIERNAFLLKTGFYCNIYIRENSEIAERFLEYIPNTGHKAKDIENAF